MTKNADQLVEGIRRLLAKYSLPGIINQIGPVFHMMFTQESKVEDFAAFTKRDAAKYSEFSGKMLEEGVLVEETLAAVDRVLAHL
ncbi:hypothetical protein AB4114_03400 [Paenibacillus sp. 2RAB27]|uniref:hypothetical protein n=1 Tax=Paenibacillus sp. 2RAB27 TaxID=3232991 RepID=UPI003F9A708B